MHISWFDVGLGTFICLLFLFIMIRSGVRLYHTFSHRSDPVYRMELSYRVISFIFAVLLFALPAYFEARLQLANAQATKITRKVVGNKQVYVRCQRSWADILDVKSEMRSISYAGWVEGGHDTKMAHLTSSICLQLVSWVLSNKQNSTEDQIVSLHVVIHEAVHLSGEHNESMTEYKASELFEDIAVSMGASSTEAKRMNNFYKTRINPLMPEAYRVDYAAKEQEKAEDKSPGETEWLSELNKKLQLQTNQKQ